MKTQELIQGILKYARPEILKEFRPDSCIASTAVALDIFDYFGICAEPFPVRTLIFNQPYASRIEKGSPFPKGDQIKSWSEEDGSYSVGIGLGSQQPNKWAGHLVVLIEKRLLLDLSIDQATRPQYKMQLNPFCMEINEDFLAGKPIVFSQNDCIIRIDPLPNNDVYTLSPDWTFVGRRKKIVDNILKNIKDLKCQI